MSACHGAADKIVTPIAVLTGQKLDTTQQLPIKSQIHRSEHGKNLLARTLQLIIAFLTI
jgi:hypothetical protein